MRHQNLDYSLYVLTALFHESWVTEPWEITDKQESDMAFFEYEKSRSEKYVEFELSKGFHLCFLHYPQQERHMPMIDIHCGITAVIGNWDEGN